MAKSTKKNEGNAISIAPPNFKTALLKIRGTTPYVQNKFSAKVQEEMRAKHEAGSTAKSRSKREPKNFEKLYRNAMHIASDSEGWIGIPAPGIRAALISACRTAGVVMTRAKLAVFVEADGLDSTDGTPLIKIIKGEPFYHETMVRNADGTPDVRPRPMWAPGWEADVRIRFDADMLTLEDIANLLLRAGQQVGIGEGRPDSKKSCGMGWGLFEIVTQAEEVS